MEIVAKKFVFLIPSLPLPLQRKCPTDAVWNGGMGISAYLLERREGKGGSIEDGATRHGEVQRAAQRTRGKPRFPAAVTEVLQPSLSCVHGLRLQVFCRQRRKKEMDKTDLSVLHKHIKEVPTTMAVSLVTLWSSWAFLCLCRF